MNFVCVSVRELRANLSVLLREARNGTTFHVISQGQLIAEIRPPSAALVTTRRPGALKGKICMADDFDLLPAEVLDAMEG